VPLGPKFSHPVPVPVTDLPVITEVAAENNALTKPSRSISPPHLRADGIEADADCYVFDAKQQTFSFEVVARRLQSGLDSYLRLLDGRTAAAVNDDLRRGIGLPPIRSSSTGPLRRRQHPEIRDIHLRGGPQFPYVLKPSASPDSTFFIDTDKTQIMPGGAAASLRAIRKD
jgi:hypothetical protein